MLSLYFKIAIRYLLKNKLYSFINIAGLAIGVASFLLIMTYVNYERSYDTFEGSENVYRVYMDYLEGDTFVPGDAMTYNQTGPVLKERFPEVVDFVRFYYFEKVTFVLGDKIFEQSRGSLADPSYFSMFSQSLTQGVEEKALENPNSIVLSKTLSKKLFADVDPIGKSLKVVWDATEVMLTVTGIMNDAPRNMHYRNNFLISFNTEKTWGIFGEQALKPNWNMNNYYTYIQLDNGINAGSLREKIIASDIEKNAEERHNIEPIRDIHLYSDKPYEVSTNGSITRVLFLSAIAFVILLLSLLNYINLSTTKSLERAKEIGIRKVSGANRGQLIFQSLFESLVLNGISIFLGILLVLMVVPFFNNLLDTSLTFGHSNFFEFLPGFSIILIGMLLSGLYPAFLLSGYMPAKALKGKIASSSTGLRIRKALMMLQFLATIVLLIGTIVITKQMRFLEEQPIGVNLNQIVAIRGEVVSKNNDSLLAQDFRVLKSLLSKEPYVEKLSISETYAGDSFDNMSSTRGIILPDGKENDQAIFYTYTAQPEYFDVMDMEFIAGGTFLPSDKGTNYNVVVNETFLKTMGITDANSVIDKKLKFWGNKDWVIKGVIKDYYHFGLKKPVLPILIRHSNAKNNLLVKLSSDVTSTLGYKKVISSIESRWKEIFPESTFIYSFVDQKFQAQYNDDNTFGKAFSIFTLLAIGIAALGLFGLTSYTCIQRRKEIGVRKVNGASVGQILSLLNMDFIKWIGITFVMAIPIAWYVMNRWLEGFALKTSLSWWVFLMAGLVALVITLLTVSWQSFRAATTNPVEALRDE